MPPSLVRIAGPLSPVHVEGSTCATVGGSTPAAADARDLQMAPHCTKLPSGAVAESCPSSADSSPAVTPLHSASLAERLSLPDGESHLGRPRTAVPIWRLGVPVPHEGPNRESLAVLANLKALGNARFKRESGKNLPLQF